MPRQMPRIVRATGVSVVLALWLANPSPLQGQLAFETPRMQSPVALHGLGAHWLRAGALPGDGEAVMLTLGSSALPTGLSLRGGWGDGALGARAAFGGLDWSAPIAVAEPGRPLDLAWTAGAGVGVGEYVLVTVPVGLSAGRAFTAGRLWASPYVALGIAIDYRTGENAPVDRFGWSPSADVGMDVSLDGGRRFVLRAATSLGDRQAVAVGVLLRPGG